VKIARLQTEIAAAFGSPTFRQKEAYARFAHTLAAASLIGAITIMFSEGGFVWASFWRLLGLGLTGVILFLGGALLLKGE
jgi:hypothetical protein